MNKEQIEKLSDEAYYRYRDSIKTKDKKLERKTLKEINELEIWLSNLEKLEKADYIV